MSPTASSLIGIDLFSGAGGTSLGACQAGLTVGLAIEVDPHAAKTYQANHKATEVLNCDIRQLTTSHLRRWLPFTDSYRFHGSIGFQQQQVANAVPPALAQSVFTSIPRGVVL